MAGMCLRVFTTSRKSQCKNSTSVNPDGNQARCLSNIPFTNLKHIDNATMLWIPSPHGLDPMSPYNSDILLNKQCNTPCSKLSSIALGS